MGTKKQRAAASTRAGVGAPDGSVPGLEALACLINKCPFILSRRLSDERWLDPLPLTNKSFSSICAQWGVSRPSMSEWFDEDATRDGDGDSESERPSEGDGNPAKLACYTAVGAEGDGSPSGCGSLAAGASPAWSAAAALWDTALWVGWTPSAFQLILATGTTDLSRGVHGMGFASRVKLFDRRCLYPLFGPHARREHTRSAPGGRIEGLGG